MPHRSRSVSLALKEGKSLPFAPFRNYRSHDDPLRLVLCFHRS